MDMHNNAAHQAQEAHQRHMDTVAQEAARQVQEEFMARQSDTMAQQSRQSQEDLRRHMDTMEQQQFMARHTRPPRNVFEQRVQWTVLALVAVGGLIYHFFWSGL